MGFILAALIIAAVFVWGMYSPPKSIVKSRD